MLDAYVIISAAKALFGLVILGLLLVGMVYAALHRQWLIMTGILLVTFGLVQDALFTWVLAYWVDYGEAGWLLVLPGLLSVMLLCMGLVFLLIGLVKLVKAAASGLHAR